MTDSDFLLITGGYDNNIRFFEPTNQNPVRSLQFCDQVVLRIALSSRGPICANEPLFLVAGGSPSIMVFDISGPNTQTNLFTVYQNHTDAITGVGFEPYHTSFVWSSSEDGTLRTWIPKLAMASMPYLNTDRNPILNKARNYPSVPCKFLNKDSSGALIPIHDTMYHPHLDMFFTADAQGRLRVWEHKKKSLRTTLIPHSSCRNLQCLDLSHDYTILCAANFDGIVFVYEVEKILAGHVLPRLFRAHDGYVPRIKLSQTCSMIVCTSLIGTIKVFRMRDIMEQHERPSKVAPIREFSSFKRGAIWDATFIEDRDEYVITAGSHAQVWLWDLNDLDRSNAYTGHPKTAVCVAIREKIASQA